MIYSTQTLKALVIAAAALLRVPLKVSAVTGRLPAGYSHEAFPGEDLAIIARGFAHFRTRPVVDPGRAAT